MILLAVNHHYVSPEPYRGRAIFPTSVEGLRAQVEELARTFELVSREDLLEAAAGGRSLPERGCVITFDDGLRSQFELGLPVLEALGAPAIFFVCGRPLLERRALSVHKIHAVREALDEEAFLEILADELPDHAGRLEELADEATAVYRYDTPAAACVKYLLNFALPWGIREVVADRIFARAIGDEPGFCDELYMPADQVATLEREHGAVGAHSYAHRPLGLLDDPTLRDDLRAGTRVLEEITGSAPAAISYPYGSAQAATTTVALTAASLGFRVGFTMERALNLSTDVPLMLARVDTNDAPGGRAPRLRVEAGELVCEPGMGADRVRHLAP